jgi:hypothetical protein
MNKQSSNRSRQQCACIAGGGKQEMPESTSPYDFKLNKDRVRMTLN